MKCTSHESFVSHIPSIPVMEYYDYNGKQRLWEKMLENRLKNFLFFSLVDCGKFFRFTQIVDLLISCFHCVTFQINRNILSKVWGGMKWLMERKYLRKYFYLLLFNRLLDFWEIILEIRTFNKFIFRFFWWILDT